MGQLGRFVKNKFLALASEVQDNELSIEFVVAGFGFISYQNHKLKNTLEDKRLDIQGRKVNKCAIRFTRDIH